MKDIELKKYLDGLYKKYRKKHSSKDPVWTLHRFSDIRDIEIIGFIISCYTYGQVDVINAFVERILKITGNNIYEFTVNFSKSKDKKRFTGMYYRFNNESHLVNLFDIIKQALAKHGSLNNLFLDHYNNTDQNIVNALTGFTQELKLPLKDKTTFKHFIPDPGANSASKRLNLFLRWMVRKDEIDLGAWNGIPKSKLIIPLDIHVHRVARQLGLVKRASPDLKFAIELTEKLKQFYPRDPVKYDFALCHIGIDKVT
ncbi:MAG TPA: TIGR02757 family protein [Ignavibacteria bacterium]|nr:TIGR02757 family protein [Ignavibacteria bacterium]